MEGVDGENGVLLVALGVVHDVQVNELLELQVRRRDALEHIGEEAGHVLADGHQSYGNS